jgi:hypothetical protein
MNDRQFLFLGLAAVAVSFWYQQQQSELQTQVNNCKAQLQGFKDGVIYGK